MNKEEIIQLRKQHEENKKSSSRNEQQRQEIAFQEKCEDIIENLDKRIKGAIRNDYLELYLIKVNSELVDISKICDRYNLSYDCYSQFNPYQDKTVIKNPALLKLWDVIESKDLLPVFLPIDNDISTEINLGIQLPNEDKYPRNDTAFEIAQRAGDHTIHYYLNEDGTF